MPEIYTWIIFLLLSLMELLIVCLAPSLVQQIMFGILLGFLFLLEVTSPLESKDIRPKGWYWLILGFLSLFISFFMWYFWRSTADSLCVPELWFQGHAAWHVFSSIAALCAYFYLDSEPDWRRSAKVKDDVNKYDYTTVANGTDL